MRPRLTILMTTWAPPGEEGQKRADATRKALGSWEEHIRYDGELALHVADDGSMLSGYATGPDVPPASLWTRGPVTFSRQESGGLGASLNAGFRAAFERGPLALYVCDDWALLEDFDLTDWVALLVGAEYMEACENIGMVRFAPAHPNICGRIEAFHSKAKETGDAFCLRFMPQVTLDDGVAGHVGDQGSKPLANNFATRPALYHQRFIEKWGWFNEGIDAIYCEWLYNQRWSQGKGSDIVYALPKQWYHIDSNRLSLVNPSISPRW